MGGGALQVPEPGIIESNRRSGYYCRLRSSAKKLRRQADLVVDLNVRRAYDEEAEDSCVCFHVLPGTIRQDLLTGGAVTCGAGGALAHLVLA